MNQDALLRAVKTLGLPTLAAAILGWVLIGEVRADQKQFKAQHDAMLVEQQNLARGILKIADRDGEMRELQRQALSVLRVMCLQHATSQRDRMECMR